MRRRELTVRLPCAVGQGFDLLSEAQKRMVYNDSFESHQSRTLLRMRATVEMMYNAFASVFDDQEMGRVDSMTQSTTVKTGAPDSGGSFVELRSSTPLRCGCHDGGELIWRFIASSSTLKTDDYFVKVCVCVWTALIPRYLYDQFAD